MGILKSIRVQLVPGSKMAHCYSLIKPHNFLIS